MDYLKQQQKERLRKKIDSIKSTDISAPQQREVLVEPKRKAITLGTRIHYQDKNYEVIALPDPKEEGSKYRIKSGDTIYTRSTDQLTKLLKSGEAFLIPPMLKTDKPPAEPLDSAGVVDFNDLMSDADLESDILDTVVAEPKQPQPMSNVEAWTPEDQQNLERVKKGLEALVKIRDMLNLGSENPDIKLGTPEYDKFTERFDRYITERKRLEKELQELLEKRDHAPVAEPTPSLPVDDFSFLDKELGTGSEEGHMPELTLSLEPLTPLETETEKERLSQIEALKQEESVLERAITELREQIMALPDEEELGNTEELKTKTFSVGFIKSRILPLLQNHEKINEVISLDVKGAGKEILLNTTVESYGFNIKVQATLGNQGNIIAVKNYNIDAMWPAKGKAEKALVPKLTEVSKILTAYIEKQENKKVEKMEIINGELKVTFK